MRKFGLNIVTGLLLLFVGWPNFAYAQIKPSDYVIGEIRIEGNKSINTEEILAVMKTRAGDKMSPEAVMDDLKAINDMGYFDERKLEVNPQLADGKVLLTIRVEENPVIRSFSVTGNSVYSGEELKPFFSEQIGKPQNLELLSRAIEKLEKKYHDQGYVIATVRNVVDDPDGKVNVCINEGFVGKVEVSGASHSIFDMIYREYSFKPGFLYNENRLKSVVREFCKNGSFGDIRRSLVPVDENSGQYVLKIALEERASTRLRAVFEVEELYENPRYGYELVRYESTEDTPITSGSPKSDSCKLIWRKIRLNSFSVNISPQHKPLYEKRTSLNAPKPAGQFAGPVLRNALLVKRN